MGASKEPVCDRCGRPRRVISSGGRSLCGSCYKRLSRPAPPSLRALQQGGSDLCAGDGRRHLNLCRLLRAAACHGARPAGVPNMPVRLPRLPTCKEVASEGSGDLCALRRNRPPTVRWSEGPVCDHCYNRQRWRRRGICNNCRQERRSSRPPGRDRRCAVTVPALLLCRRTSVGCVVARTSATSVRSVIVVCSRAAPGSS